MSKFELYISDDGDPTSLQERACKETAFPKNDKYMWWSYQATISNSEKIVERVVVGEEGNK